MIGGFCASILGVVTPSSLHENPVKNGSVVVPCWLTKGEYTCCVNACSHPLFSSRDEQ